MTWPTRQPRPWIYSESFDAPIQIGEHGYGAVFPVRAPLNGAAISSLAASGPGMGSGTVSFAFSTGHRVLDPS